MNQQEFQITVLEFQQMALKQFKQIEAQFKKIDARFERLEGRFDKLERKVTRMDGTLSNVVVKLIEHDRRFDQLVTKDEFKDFKSQCFSHFDKLTGTIERHDQELLLIQELNKGNHSQE